MIEALETDHLSKRYGRKWALRDCTLQVPIGCIAGLVGPNGVGKTTLLHLITGLLAPSNGTITVLGHTPGKDMKQLLLRIGFVSYDVWSLPAIAYALFAFTLGVCMGTIVRKAVPAMALTLVIFVIVRILIEIFWRPYFLPPLVSLTPLYNAQNPPQTAMQIGFLTDVDRQGNTVAPNKVCPRDPALDLHKNNTSSASLQLNMALPLMNINKPLKIASASAGPGGSQPSTQDQYQAYLQCTKAHDLQQKYWYQPADRFWLFQEIESGIYVLMSALLFALTFWWTKYRIIGK